MKLNQNRIRAESELNRNLCRGRSATHSSRWASCSPTASPSPCRTSSATHSVRHYSFFLFMAISSHLFGDSFLFIRRFLRSFIAMSNLVGNSLGATVLLFIRRFLPIHSAISSYSFGEFIPVQESPRPTRAEVADVTNAVLERDDAVSHSAVFHAHSAISYHSFGNFFIFIRRFLHIHSANL